MKKIEIIGHIDHGKTALTSSVVEEFKRAGKKVTLIDLDNQFSRRERRKKKL